MRKLLLSTLEEVIKNEAEMLNEVKENTMPSKILNCIKFWILNLYVEEKFKLLCNNVEEKY